MGIENKIKNIDLLTKVFGRWPSFHDAEVVQVILDRGKNGSKNGPTLRVAIYVFEATKEVDQKGYYVLKNRSLVWLRFHEVAELQIDDFNNQNVLSDLYITDISARQLERTHFEIEFGPCFGLEMEFHCHSIEVESVEPYES